MKYKVFYGPQSKFNEIAPLNETITLSRLVRWSEINEKNESNLRIEGDFKALVIYSDEYSGVKDWFIEGFLIIIELYSNVFGYEYVYLNNPPNRILEQIEALDKSDFSIEYYNYKKITREELTFIKHNFDSKIHSQSNAKELLLQNIYDLTNEKEKKPKIIMFYGPPGVGKTETAKFLNAVLYKDTKMLRKQFSMLHNDSSYKYIFGDRSNSFAKDLVNRENNLILLDEFDKCNPIFFSAFYQLFDEGIFSDKYYEVKLYNTIIICTSNYLSLEEIKKNLGAAIYSRFDAFIPFNLLTNESKMDIINEIYIEELIKYNEIDQKIIEEENINEKLKSQVNTLNNAREIRKYLKQMMAIPLVEKL